MPGWAPCCLHPAGSRGRWWTQAIPSDRTLHNKNNTECCCMCGSLNNYLCNCVQYMFASVGAMIKKIHGERDIDLFSRERTRERVGKIFKDCESEGWEQKKKSNYKRKQISKVENRKQMVWRDSKTVKSHWQPLDCSTFHVTDTINYVWSHKVRLAKLNKLSINFTIFILFIHN